MKLPWKRNRELLEEILELVKRQTKEIVMADQDVAALIAEVTNNTNVVNSAVALINGIAAQIAAAVAAAGSLSASDRTALQASIATITSNDAALAAAVVANTPAAPAPAARPNVATPPANNSVADMGKRQTTG